ncbi:MAG: hydrogenase expression/formation protein HypE [Gammaproteobacteria bacterium]
MSDADAGCPLPPGEYDCVVRAHGGGGRLAQALLDRIFRPAFDNPWLATRHDGAVLEPGAAPLAFTTDTYVVRPIEFAGGDIGSLAVIGTCNDLAMCGARPRWLSAGFVLEEGLPLATLERVVASMRAAADRCGVAVVTADTKVVERGSGDGIYINTAGIGQIDPGLDIRPASVRPGDALLLSGDPGRHGIAVMAAREGLELQTDLASDLAPLEPAVRALVEAGIELHCLRDLTRGGLAAALGEIAAAAGVRIEIDESAVPVHDAVRAACELLGLEPLQVASEGRFAAFVAGPDAGRALQVLRGQPVATGAVIAGRVTSTGNGQVTVLTGYGVRRPLDVGSGEQLPRIC